MEKKFKSYGANKIGVLLYNRLADGSHAFPSYKDVKEAADRAGLPISEYVRRALREKILRDLGLE